MNLPKDDIVWAWNTTKLTAGQIGIRHGISRNVVLGIVHRDPRAKPRKPPTALQLKDRQIKAMEAEIARLQDIEAVLMKRRRGKKRKEALMEAQFWKALRQALYDEKPEALQALELARMEWKAAA